MSTAPSFWAIGGTRGHLESRFYPEAAAFQGRRSEERPSTIAQFGAQERLELIKDLNTCLRNGKDGFNEWCRRDSLELLGQESPPTCPVAAITAKFRHAYGSDRVSPACQCPNMRR